jgi:hypothetical protein
VFVPERVGEPFHGLARGDRVTVQVQLAMQLDERHGRAVEREDCQCGGAQMLALEGLCTRRDRWNRRRTAAVRHAVALHDVPGLDARPHDDAHLRQPGAYIGELDRKPALRRIELCRPIEQGGALRVEHGEFVPPVRHPSIAGRITNSNHDDSPDEPIGGSAPREGERTVPPPCANFPTLP